MTPSVNVSSSHATACLLRSLFDVEGMDEEQLESGSTEPFWTLIAERRMKKKISPSELERNIVEENAL